MGFNTEVKLLLRERLTFRHRSANDRIRTRPFALYSPRFVPFHPIYEAEELSFASHCPRKALFLYHRGSFVKWDINYRRDPTRSQTRFSFQNGSWNEHARIYRNSIIYILANLSVDLYFLIDNHPTGEVWQTTFREVVSHDSNIENPSNYLLDDLTSFFTRWFEEDRLNSYLDTDLHIFNVFVFNPSLTLNDTNPVNLTRGEFIGDFPLIGKVDIIDLERQSLIQLTCHNDEWLPIKDVERVRDTIGEDSPARREHIIWAPYYYKLWLLRSAIQNLDIGTLQGIHIGNETYGAIPSSVTQRIPPTEWAETLSNFAFEVAAVNSSRMLSPAEDFTHQIIDGLISCSKAYARDKYDLAVRDQNPCSDVNRVLRDEHCSMFQDCIPRSISFLLGNMSTEINRLVEKLYHERILLKSLSLYRIDHYLPQDPLLLHSEHSLFWCGTVGSATPFEIRLNDFFNVDGLEEGKSYLIPSWSPFFGPEEKHNLIEIDRENKTLLFEGETSLFPENNVTILPNRYDDRLIRREQRALCYHSLSRFNIDINTSEGQQAVLLRILQEGGRRTGQAIFGGWASFL